MDEVLAYALKLLRARDYTVVGLRQKLELKFTSVPEEVIALLLQKNFLNDRRFAENHAARRKDRGAVLLREELVARGVSPELAGEIVSGADWPSLREALAAKMNDWKMRGPLQQRDAARLFRALHRLGYDEEAIREEIEQAREKPYDQ